MRKKLLLTLLAVCAMQAKAGTITNADGTVTFQYKNDQAKEVLVDVQFAGRKAMQKDTKTGLWTVTLGPAAPDMSLVPLRTRCRCQHLRHRSR